MSAIKGSVRNFLLGKPPKPVKKETPSDKLSPSLWEKKDQVYNLLRAYQDGAYNSRIVCVGMLDHALSGLYDALVKIL